MNPLSLLGLDLSEPRPDRPVILSGDGACTAGRLLEQASFVAGILEDGGVAGRPVILNMDASPAFAAGLIGCWLAGSTPVLLDPLVKHELARAIEKTGAGALIRAASSDAGELAPGVVVVSPDGSGAPLRETVPDIPDDDPVLYLFTSGSTGEPALVPKTFEQIDVERRFISHFLGRPERTATLVPWCHIFGFLFSFVVPLRNGGTCDLTAGISPRTLLERASEGLLDLVVAVPAIYRVMNRLLENGEPGAIDPRCRFVSSGANLPGEVRTTFEGHTGARIADFYGSTEAGGVAYREDSGPWLVEPHVDWRISDDGHLEVRSASVSVPVEAEDRFYRLGDLARAQGDGFALMGRADDVVKIGGRRISLDEIQKVVEECPGVERAAVLARPVRGVMRIVACVQEEGGRISVATVKGFVRARMADHKVPRKVVVLGEFPTTPAGKVDRPALEDMLRAEEKS